MPDALPPPVRPSLPGGVRIVGLGASAGGLEPLEQFLAHLPADSGLAVLVVQHMDPLHKPLLRELLQRATEMPVLEAVDGQPIERGTVYVIPPDTELTVRGGALHLAPPGEPRGRRFPIDVLFSSMAAELGERAIGVVLSGMGADGTVGLQSIKTQGGLTLAQTPESAQFASMPRSALAAGCVDIVALPSEMPARIQRVVAAAAPPGGPPASEAGASPAPELSRILSLLREHTQHDLANYKPNTLLRRIARRMAVHNLPSMAAYGDFLQTNPQERGLLFKEMLIGVTAFFRDADAWHDLQERALPVLLERHEHDRGPLRAWVAGCSTGEEAYSLAMAFVEALDAPPPGAAAQAGGASQGGDAPPSGAAPRAAKALRAGAGPRPELQIFATDLNADAIATARAGRFAATIARELSPQRLKRFFVERAGGYQVDQRLRDMVLFAQHDVTVDPPFTRLDLVVCRNLMIYFDAELQRRLVPLFHYSLRPGGVLFLGTSETIGRAQSLFTPLDPKSRLYWRSSQAAPRSALVFPTHRRAAPRSALQENPLVPLTHSPDNLQALADQVLLQSHAPAAVLVNGAGDIVYINGRTGRYLEPAAGKANWNIHVMARPAIRTQLAVALRTALLESRPVELRALRLEEETGAAVNVTVQAVTEPKSLAGMAMIVFRDVPAAPARRGRRTAAAGAGDPGMADELLRTREEVNALRQEMRASQEELQAAIEELQSTNEELQSANEELMTSKEESQSMNEELQTINGELQSKLDELALAQSDMQNLLNSTDIATLFLDDQLNVRRYTEKITRIVHLRESDIGRPLSELASTLVYPELHADVQETLRTLAFSEKQVPTQDGLWFVVRIMPYRTQANVIQGVVITFVDITAAKALESSLRKA